jgi:hypothetical protein
MITQLHLSSGDHEPAQQCESYHQTVVRRLAFALIETLRYLFCIWLPALFSLLLLSLLSSWRSESSSKASSIWKCKNQLSTAATYHHVSREGPVFFVLPCECPTICNCLRLFFTVYSPSIPAIYACFVVGEMSCCIPNENDWFLLLSGKKDGNGR